MSADDGLVLAHLLVALGQHRRWCRANGSPLPPVLEVLFAALSASSGATGGLGRPEIAETDGAGQALLVDEAEAARRLAVSDRTVRRLVASGELPSVTIGRARRVRVSDLEGYVNALGAGRGT